jgi:hypothetical protein
MTTRSIGGFQGRDAVAGSAEGPCRSNGSRLAASRERASGARPRGVVSTRTGARFDPLLPFEAWQEIGVKVGTCANATSWWLGDWLVFGRMKYGRRYKQAIAATGLEYQTLRNYAVVARRFDMSRRRDTLTFQHHAEVCALPDEEQDRWLDRAAAGGWSRNDLRRRLRAAERSDGPPTEVFRFAVETTRADRWRQAAHRADCNYHAWILRVLDEATSEVLADNPGATISAPGRGPTRRARAVGERPPNGRNGLPHRAGMDDALVRGARAGPGSTV